MLRLYITKSLLSMPKWITKKIILDLWNMKFDDDEVKDKKIKKMLFNINIGLLEKQSNTVKKISYIL